MKFKLSKPLRFGLTLVPLFLAFLWIYPRVMPFYEPLVLGTANMVTERLSPPTRIEESPVGGWHSYVTDYPGRERHLFSWAGFVPHLVYLGMVFVPAALLATPAPWRDRFRLLAVGLLLLFLVHVLAIIVLVRGKYCLIAAPGTFACLWMLRLVYASGQVSGALLWAWLTWRYWVPEDWLVGKENS